MEKFQKKYDVNLENLIKALSILLKYENPSWPCFCEHDQFYVGVNPELVSKEDIEELDKLGFFVDEEFNECFISFAYGSC
jgi:hypothetical protein